MSKIVTAIFIFFINLYKGVVSPFFLPVCRYTPSCSSYGIEAIKKHGPLKGSFYTLKRILSCNPWGGHGYDPVP
jgi:uncharacterized protein